MILTVKSFCLKASFMYSWGNFSCKQTIIAIFARQKRPKISVNLLKLLASNNNLLCIFFGPIQVTYVTIVCLLIWSSLALPSKQVVKKADFHQTSVKEDEQVAKSTSVQKMNILQVPTNTRVVRLYNKNGYFLKISTVGKLRGTRSFDNLDSKYKSMKHKSQIQHATCTRSFIRPVGNVLIWLMSILISSTHNHTRFPSRAVWF